jgi:hypothetical protein
MNRAMENSLTESHIITLNSNSNNILVAKRSWQIATKRRKVNYNQVILIFILIFLLTQLNSFGQVGINTTNPSKSAELEIYSTEKGILLPLIDKGYSSIIKDNGSYPKGLIYFDLEIGRFMFFDGSSWQVLNPETNKFDETTETYSIEIADKVINMINNNYNFDKNSLNSYSNNFNSKKDIYNFDTAKIFIDNQSEIKSESEINVMGYNLVETNITQNERITSNEEKLKLFDTQWQPFYIFPHPDCNNCSQINSYKAYKMRHGKILYYAIYIDISLKNIWNCQPPSLKCLRFMFVKTEAWENGNPINSNLYDQMQFENCKVIWKSQYNANYTEIILNNLPSKINLLISIPIN